MVRSFPLDLETVPMGDEQKVCGPVQRRILPDCKRLLTSDRTWAKLASSIGRLRDIIRPDSRSGPL